MAIIPQLYAALRREHQRSAPLESASLDTLLPRQESICVAYGATVTYAKQLMYGKQSEVTLDNTSPLFAGFPEKTLVARYHSLAAVDLPECLKVTAITPDGEIMAVQHRDYPIYGVQSHPESIMTPLGKEILKDAVLQ